MNIKSLLLATLSFILVSFHTHEEPMGCKNAEEIELVISTAIYVGAPTYNNGNHLGCYRIYEGAAYKILHLYGSKCKDSRDILNEALKECHETRSSATEKAWVMRMAFDKILGVPTETAPIEEPEPEPEKRS